MVTINSWSRPYCSSWCGDWILFPGHDPNQVLSAHSGLHHVGDRMFLFVQKVLAPKFRGWLRDVVLDEKKATETKSEVQGKSFKLSPLEEAVGAAAAAANAAAAAAAEVANTSREVLKLQAEGEM